jgi:hypothetical protein
MDGEREHLGVIPAQAGIQDGPVQFLDSGLRGNDELQHSGIFVLTGMTTS